MEPERVMKSILVIDESQLFRDYLKRKLEDYGFEVSVGVSGLDAISKLRSEMPDLLITDYHLTRKSVLEVLAEKQAHPNTADIPVIMASTKIDRDALVQVARYNVKKFLTKPIRVDALLEAVSETLNVPVSIDTTPCIVEAHVNDEIVFIEVAQGLNREKVDLLRYKIRELLDLYAIRKPRILVIMTSIEVSTADTDKLSALVTTVVEGSGAHPKNVKFLTNSDYVKEFFMGRSDLSAIEVTSNLERAMDGLLNVRSDGPILERNTDSMEGVLSTSAPKKQKGEAINLRFQQEQGAVELADLGDTVEIVIVDDDIIIQELIKTAFSDTKFQIKAFNNGREFVDAAPDLNPDLVFLDLMMPEMNGFEVLQELRRQEIKLPIIVLSALSKRETVAQALKQGVSSYMIKPLKPQALRKKASEVLRANF